MDAAEFESQYSFPLQDLVPKSETEASLFLRNYPDYDGRGVVIAIIDTGVDPLAKGLQTTSDGRRKILDCVDTTGSGDVDTSTRLSPDSDGFITGLTGRKLLIPSHWHNPSNSYNIGVKNVFDLYYASTKRRMSEQRKKAFWDGSHERLLATIKQRLLQIEQQEKSASQSDPKSDVEVSDSSASPKGKAEKEALKLEKEDLCSQLKLLESLDKKFPDQGPVVDVITWNDGSGKRKESEGSSDGSVWSVERSGWCVCVDTSFSGDLDECKVLRPFREEGQVGRISEECLCNFTVEGVYGAAADTTVLVATSGSHGTHVAAIAAANRPDNADLNGVAPGAQIVSIKIGDSRLHAMETGTAMIRAMDYCNRNNIHIANYSFGEPAAFQTSSSRIIEAIERSIHSFNLCFVTSHGNNGPGLRTGSAPGNTCNGAFGVTAYLSPAMRRAQYALETSSASSAHYFWSSRGPCMDGNLGVTVCAPGGAITSISQTMHKGEGLMNGTSMASPNVAGNLALIISGLKHQGIGYSPFSVERSVKTTALKMSDHCSLSSGGGVIQCLKAFEHLKEFTSNMLHLNRVFFQVTTGKEQKRGVLIQGKGVLSERVCRFQLSVDLKFSPDVTSEEKCDLALPLVLICHEAWVSVPSYLYLTNSTRQFSVTVDTSMLKTGAHFTEILAFDEKNFRYGPVFRFPVTVLKPVNDGSNDTEFNLDALELSPGSVIRHFFRPPEGASYMTVDLTSSSEQVVKLCLHMVHIKDTSPHREDSQNKQIILHSDAKKTFSYPVSPGVITEVCLAQINSCFGSHVVKMRVSFRGVLPSSDSFAMHHFEPALRIDVKNSLERVTVEPNAVLNHYVTPLRPADFRIVPLDLSRDSFTLGPVKEPSNLCVTSPKSVEDPCEVDYALELTYNYSHNVKEKEVYPECPLLSGQLYESVFGSQTWAMFDTNKQVMGYGDFKTEKYSCSLSKGDYTIKLWIRHPKYEVLEKLQALQFVVARKTPNINLSFFTTPNLVSDDAFKSHALIKHSSVSMFASPLSEEKLPKPHSPGSFLTGKIHFISEEPGKSCSWYPFVYHLGPLVAAPKKENSSQKASKEKSFADCMKEAKLAFLQKKSADITDDDVIKMYEELMAEFPTDLAVPSAFSAFLASGPTERQSKYREKLISVCESGVSKLDMTQILAYFGCHKNAREDLFGSGERKSSVGGKTSREKQSVEGKSETEDVSVSSEADSSLAADCRSEDRDMEKCRNMLVEFLQRKCVALLEIDPVDEPAVEQCWNSLRKLVDPFSDSKTTQLALKYCRHKELHGMVASKLLQEYETANSRAALKSFASQMRAMKWDHVADRIENSSLLVRFPPSFPPF